jgi:hypothetical protein
MTHFRRRVFGLVTVTGVLVVGAAGSAEAAAIGDCTVEAATPTPVKIAQAGHKHAYGRAQVRCATAQVLDLQMFLWGDDPVRDDRVASGYGQFAIPAAQVLTLEPKIQTGAEGCNEDIGGDELYSKVRARLRKPDGTYTGWTLWERGRTVRYSC